MCVAVLCALGDCAADRAAVFYLHKRAEKAIKYSAEEGRESDDQSRNQINKSEGVGKGGNQYGGER